MNDLDSLVEIEEAPALAADEEAATVAEPEEDDAVAAYLQEIAAVPLLTAEEERILAHTLECGRFLEQRLGDGASPAAAASVLLEEMEQLQPLLQAVAAHLGLSHLPLPHLIAHPAFRSAVDGVTDRSLADALGDCAADLPRLSAVSDILSRPEMAPLLAGQPADPGAIARCLAAVQRQAQEARERFICANLRLVVSIAKHYASSTFPLLDVVQEGNIGLMKAVERFDHRKGYKFSTYATWWIRQAIARGVADRSRTVRVPVHMHEVLNRFRRTVRRLVQEHGREPTAHEIARAMGIEIDQVRLLTRISWEPISMDMRVGEEDGEARLGDFIEDEDSPSPVESANRLALQQQVRQALMTLTPREQKVIMLRYGLEDGRPRTLEEVGQIFGVTRERIRQVEARALRKLRYNRHVQHLREFLHM